MDNTSAAGVKRKRAEEDNDSISIAPSTKQLVLQELDLELALKDRIAATVESRITWALLLQEALNKELNVPAPLDSNFCDAALSALDAIDSPCGFMYQRESILGFESTLAAPPEALRKAVRTHSARHRLPRTNQTVHKLLFVRNTATDPPLVARLQCPDCNRWDFSTTQGFLNHCRIRHQREYGGHDECIQNCSVLVPEGERDWVLQNGTEVTGVGIPSLRRLFEIAVSGKSSSIFPAPQSVPTPPADENQLSEEAALVDSTHLSRTLGIHKDTPALAPFLGRAPHRRCINVTEQEEVLDIDSEDRAHVVKWRMPFSHRNRARPELDDDLSLSNHTTTSEAQEKESESLLTSSTRFHIVARVLVADRSRWLPPNKRPSLYPQHTHGWMISIDSPSYSLHVASILASATVSCLTDPPPSTLIDPIVITEPPFMVTGTTDQPFLAQVSLVWTGPHNSPMEVEHWVETDPMKTGSPVLGGEQLIDIELDRKTELLPIRTNLIQWRDLPSFPTVEDPDPTSNSGASPEVPAYALVLSSLLPRVPMTMRDVKQRGANAAPYKVAYMLASTPASFKKLVPGRQKAIEWGRARALQSAYSEYRCSTSQDLLPLTVGDVYCWLEEENLFPRAKQDERSRIRDMDSTSQTLDTFCPSCGCPSQSHTTISRAGSLRRLSCLTDFAHYNQPPLVDITWISGYRRLSPAAVTSSSIFMNNRDLVLAANPTLTIAVRKLVSLLKLPSFETRSILGLDRASSVAGITRPGAQHTRKDELEQHLAPYALVSLVTTRFVHSLLTSALKASVTAGVEQLKHPSSRPYARLITPSHVYLALHRDLLRERDPTKAVTACALAHLGTRTDINLRSGDGIEKL